VEKHIFPTLDRVPVVRGIVTVIFVRFRSVEPRVPVVQVDDMVDGRVRTVELVARLVFEEVKTSFDEFVFEVHESRAILRSRL